MKPSEASLSIALCLLLNACGGGSGSSVNNTPITPPVTPHAGTLSSYAGYALPTVAGETYTLTTTGELSGGGYMDGVGKAARFASPGGLAFDGSGNLFVADSWNCVIRKISFDGNGVATVSTFAGQVGVSENHDGAAVQDATFSYPTTLATDAAGNVYVIDNTSLRKISGGQVTTLLSGLMISRGLAVDASGTIYLAQGSAIRQISTDGSTNTVMPGTEGISFNNPSALGLHGGYLYVADYNGSMILKVSVSNGQVATIAGTATPGYGNDAFAKISGIVFDNSENIYVAEEANRDVRKISKDGSVTSIEGSPSLYGAQDITPASFEWPLGLAIDNSGNLYVSDFLATTIRRISSDTSVTTVAGAPRLCGLKDGDASSALFNDPRTMRLDRNGNMYINDFDNSAIRKISSDGTTVSTALTLTTSNFFPSGSMVPPMDFVIDDEGNFFFTTTASIREISSAGVPNIFAGSVFGDKDGPATTAEFGYPMGLCRDQSGNFYVTDNRNYNIRKITVDSNGAATVSTIAGSGTSGSSDNNDALQATFEFPWGIACGPDGSLYVSDYDANTIRKISFDANGTHVSTLAGKADTAGSTDGSDARFFGPRGLDLDKDGNIYVADYRNHTIRKITPDGTVSTVVGVAGQAENQLGTLPASIAFPASVTVGPSASSGTTTLFISLPDAILKATF